MSTPPKKPAPKSSTPTKAAPTPRKPSKPPSNPFLVQHPPRSGRAGAGLSKGTKRGQ